MTEVPDWKWNESMLRPYFEVVLESFGADRVMFGSDRPVCNVTANYADWFNVVENCIRPLPASEGVSIMEKSCAGAYGLVT